LILGYAGITIFMALITIASLRGIIPPFLIQGVGPTIWRQVVLGAAAILFAFSFLIFMGMYLRSRDVFLYWYSSALALTVINLSASLINKAAGSPIGWTARFSQYLGGIYLLIAIITAIRNAQAKRVSLDNILGVSFGPADEKFRALAENSPDSIARFDREMRQLYVNPAGIRLYGNSAGFITGRTIEETGFPETYCNLWRERVQKVFETGQPSEAEDYLPTEQGMRFYLSHCVPEYGADGAVANVLVVSRDLTERKRAEEALLEAHERAVWLARFPEQNPNPIIRVSADGTILYCNPAAARLSEWACEVGQFLQGQLFSLVSRAVVQGREVQQDLQLGERFYILWIVPFLEERYANVYGRDITIRKQAEDELKKAHDELEVRVRERTVDLEKANEALRHLSSRLLSAQEEERKRVAGEIHDSLGGCLSGIKFKVGKTLQEIEKTPHAVAESLNAIMAVIQEGIEECRRMQQDLRPSILDDLGLIATFSWFCRRFETIYSAIQIKQEIGIEEGGIPNALKIVIYRITQEAMNNIAKHSKANQVLLALRKTDQAIQLVVRDNGHGFMVENILSQKRSGRGFGLDSMRERTELAGGSFKILSTDSGTEIQASWPLSPRGSDGK
jgi:PAS domain S-box-containing protein